MSCIQNVVVYMNAAAVNALLRHLKGVLHPIQKFACFVLYLKIINTFLKNDICIL